MRIPGSKKKLRKNFDFCGHKETLNIYFNEREVTSEVKLVFLDCGYFPFDRGRVFRFSENIKRFPKNFIFGRILLPHKVFLISNERYVYNIYNSKCAIQGQNTIFFPLFLIYDQDHREEAIG